jgi:hypothetical protein
MKFKTTLLILTLFAASFTAKSQKIMRNLGFEYQDARDQMISWVIQNSNGKYIIKADSVAHSGNSSVFVTPISDTATNRGEVVCFSGVKAPNLSFFRKVKVSAYIKTENLTDGKATIGVQLNNEKGWIDDRFVDDKEIPTGTTDWRKYTVEIPLTYDVQVVTFAFKMTGHGKAWVDDFEVLFDDVPVGENAILSLSKAHKN